MPPRPSPPRAARSQAVEDDERAARLADYAGRCSDLAAAASGSRVTAPELRAIGHADATSAAWIDIRHTRERAGMYRH